MKYTVCKEYSVEDIQRVVGQFLSLGWSLQGGICVEYSDHRRIYYQAMVK